jgi:uncharacterized protein (TIGR02391 family)
MDDNKMNKETENQLHVQLNGAPDVVIGCITNLTRNYISGNYYKILKASGKPDFENDSNYPASYSVKLVRDNVDINIGKIILLKLPRERTLFQFEKPNTPDSPLGHFLDSVLTEFKHLGFIDEEKGNTLEKREQKVLIKKSTELFDSMQFHPKVVKSSKALFSNGHYAQAIFEAFKAVENFVQEKSGSKLYGKQLMAIVFNEEKPIIQVPEGGYFDKDVQEGFKFLFMGASQGIRNPKAHKDIVQNDPYITLEYLGFASFLLKRIDYWEAGKTPNAHQTL